MDPNRIREVVRELYPGDEHKALRNAIYKEPGFLSSDPGDAEIHALAAKILGQKTPAPEVAAPEPPFGLTASIDDPYTEVRALVATLPLQVVVVTAADYAEADKWFSSIKKMLKAVEERRIEAKKPYLEKCQDIDAQAREAKDFLTLALKPVEEAMVGFKAREREALREQEMEKLRLQREAEAEAQRLRDEAAAKLREATETALAEEDPFLAALAADDVAAARGEVLTAAREAVALLTARPREQAWPPAAAPGSRTSYPWVVEVVNESQVDRAYCSPDSRKLNALAKLLKEQLGDIRNVNPSNYPGLVIKEDVRIGGR